MDASRVKAILAGVVRGFGRFTYDVAKIGVGGAVCVLLVVAAVRVERANALFGGAGRIVHDPKVFAQIGKELDQIMEVKNRVQGVVNEVSDVYRSIGAKVKFAQALADDPASVAKKGFKCAFSFHIPDLEAGTYSVCQAVDALEQQYFASADERVSRDERQQIEAKRVRMREDAIVSALATAKQRLDSLQSGTAADRLQTVNQQLEKALGGSEGASVAKMTGMQTRMMRDLLMQQRQLNKLLATHVRLEASKDLQAHSIALRQ